MYWRTVARDLLEKTLLKVIIPMCLSCLYFTRTLTHTRADDLEGGGSSDSGEDEQGGLAMGGEREGRHRMGQQQQQGYRPMASRAPSLDYAVGYSQERGSHPGRTARGAAQVCVLLSVLRVCKYVSVNTWPAHTACICTACINM